MGQCEVQFWERAITHRPGLHGGLGFVQAQEEQTLTFKLEALLTMATVRLIQAACHIERCDKDEMKQKKVKWIEATG